MIKIRLFLSLSSVLVLGILSHTAIAQPHSAYTSINDAHCRLAKQQHEAFSIRHCPNLGGYQIQRIDSDDRSGLNIIYGKHEIAYSGNALGTSLGDKIEWRSHPTRQYYALIFRTYEPPMDTSTGMFLSHQPKIQKLVVVRLNKARTCLLGVIPPSPTMNEQARQLADNMHAKCVE